MAQFLWSSSKSSTLCASSLTMQTTVGCSRRGRKRPSCIVQSIRRTEFLSMSQASFHHCHKSTFKPNPPFRAEVTPACSDLSHCKKSQNRHQEPPVRRSRQWAPFLFIILIILSSQCQLNHPQRTLECRGHRGRPAKEL